MSDDESIELRDKLRMAAEFELDVDPLLEYRKPQLLQPGDSVGRLPADGDKRPRRRGLCCRVSNILRHKQASGEVELQTYRHFAERDLLALPPS